MKWSNRSPALHNLIGSYQDYGLRYYGTAKAKTLNRITEHREKTAARKMMLNSAISMPGQQKSIGTARNWLI
jgi:hypothetical protein